MTWILALGFSLSLLIIERLVISSFKCSICGREGKDVLRYSNRKTKRFCRTHMIDEFKKEFLKIQNKIVVIYPKLEEKRGSSYTYQYYSLSDLKKYNLQEIIGDLVTQGLNSISGACATCKADAQVAYFGADSFRWEHKGGSAGWELPAIEKINHTAEILCTRCVLDLILPSLRNFKGNFEEPVVLHYAGEGIFLPWQV
ncbi:MAG: hypothetical protein PHU96_00815 [Candidatus Omnitrophica bacterium]|nr:hypothetical protein [Candidatus Omnitrophota bacterium]